jgi:hypothetical protein
MFDGLRQRPKGRVLIMCARQDGAKISLPRQCTHWPILGPARASRQSAQIYSHARRPKDVLRCVYVRAAILPPSQPVSRVIGASFLWRPLPLGCTVQLCKRHSWSLLHEAGCEKPLETSQITVVL